MKDFTSDRIIVSYLGADNDAKTATALVNKFKEVTMVPEAVFSKGAPKTNSLLIKDDRDNFDYILSIEEMINLFGGKFKQKRKLIHRFTKNYPDHKVIILDFSKTTDVIHLNNLLTRWKDLKKSCDKEVDREFKALQRLVENSSLYRIVNVGILYKDKLVAFTTNEIRKDYTIGGFGKADFLKIFVATILRGKDTPKADKKLE